MTTAHPRRPRHRLPVVLYAHPIELALAVALTLAGLRSLIQSAAVPGSLEASASHLAVLAWQVGSVAGGLGLLVGLLGRRRAFFRALERASCFIVGSVAAAYAVALAGTGEPGATLSAGTLAAIAAGLLLRAQAIRMTEDVIRHQLQVAADDDALRDALLDLIDGRPPKHPEDRRP